MSAVDWIDHTPEGFPAGTWIEHIAPTCIAPEKHYVAPVCSEWTQLIHYPATEVLAVTGGLPWWVTLLLVIGCVVVVLGLLLALGSWVGAAIGRGIEDVPLLSKDCTEDRHGDCIACDCAHHDVDALPTSLGWERLR